MTTTILRTTTRTVVPLILMLSIALFLQGHNLPGGGFIAGVLTATAFALVYMAYGLDFLEEEMLAGTRETITTTFQHATLSDYYRLFAAGLAIAVASGLVPVALELLSDAGVLAADYEFPFLTQAYWILEHVPVYGEVELASAVVFDLGVYCVVVGSVLTILSVVGAE